VNNPTRIKNYKISRFPKFILLLFLTVILAGCNTDNTPLVYGTWDQPDSSLKTIRRVNADGSSPASIIESTVGLVVQKYSSRHNYANPISPDGNFLSVYAQNEEGNWELNILPTRADGNTPLFNHPMGSQPSLSISGFSPDSRYFVFTEQNPESGLFTIQIYDLRAKALLAPKGGAFFADFFPGSSDLLTVGVGPTGAIAGVQRVTLPTRAEQSIYKPQEGEQIGLLLVSPDKKDLLVYDLASGKLDRVPVDGGPRSTIYEFSGDIGAAFTPGAGYLVLTDLTQAVQQLIVFDPQFREIYRQDGIGSSALAFSGDGKAIAYQTGSPEEMTLNILNLDPLTKPVKISDSGVFYQPRFAPDGSRMVYIEYKGAQEKTGELYAANTDGTGVYLLDEGVTSFAFGVNNTLLFFKVDATDPLNPVSSLYRAGLDGSAKARVAQGEGGFSVLLGP
jgi:Tol biopolymer transport system component